jgi:hypothetical protein
VDITTDTHQPGAPVPVALTPTRTTVGTTKVEQDLLSRLGGTPWAGPDPTGATLKAARRRYGALRLAAGYTSTGDTRWLTVDNAKFKKAVKNAKRNGPAKFAGVTLHAARGAARVWATLDAVEKAALATALDHTVESVERVLRLTVCPHSTPECVKGCVVEMSHRGTSTDVEKTRLLRTLFWMLHPAEAFELTHHKLGALADRYRSDKVRWRVNIADDIRHELVAPGLFTLGIPAYAYTKHPISQRPERLGMRVVYSATERWSDADIVNACTAGHTVAVVFDTGKNKPLPATWHGVPVVDGDETDDLHQHPYGAIVGLRVKGPTTALRRDLIDAGFARPASPGPLRLAA